MSDQKNKAMEIDNHSQKTRMDSDTRMDSLLKEEIKQEVEDKVTKKIKINDTSNINKWWEKDEDENDDVKWIRLEHHGVEFPPNWQRHHKKIYLKEGRQSIPMTIHDEEMATYWAQSIGTEWETKEKYKHNFNQIFIASLQKNEVNKDIKNIDQIDFSEIQQYLQEQKEIKKNKSQEEKKQLKEAKEQKDKYHGIALVDGVSEKVGGYLIEAPTLFKGRGDHPKAGYLKGRIMPEDITINIGRDSAIPKCNMKGHCWKDIVHNNEVTWLAFYKDETINTSYKYIFLSAASKFKGLNDRKKYEKARKLKNCIDKVRQDYQNLILESDEQKRQLGVATYLIDKLALRVGNEKTEDEADTVGCCSLRKEHIQFTDDSQIILDFLGKDSMRYLNTVQVQESVYQNLLAFTKGKEQNDDLFDKINASVLNDYLRSQMEGLTAKVFRTYNASYTLEQELNKEDISSLSLDDKVDFYDNANKQVAILCNHQKTASKNFDIQLEKQEDKIKHMQNFQNQLKKMLTDKNLFERLKGTEEVVYLVEDEKEKQKKSNQYIKKFPADKNKVKQTIEKLDGKIDADQQKKNKKESNKNIALGTSKINYNDPRITVVWCKNNEVPIEKVFTKTLRTKFPWAMYIEPSWRF